MMTAGLWARSLSGRGLLAAAIAITLAAILIWTPRFPTLGVLVLGGAATSAPYSLGA
ncbi:protein of unknown function (plasmid) [Aminobacter niigataensis]|nr:protein of unknown function [Aminobacter niigataensis]